MNNTEMTKTTLTFEELNTLMELIEFHDDWDEVSEIMGSNITSLYDKLSEMRNQI